MNRPPTATMVTVRPSVAKPGSDTSAGKRRKGNASLEVGGQRGCFARVTFESKEVRPLAKARTVLMDGAVVAVPGDWALLPPGDAALSRRIKADGPSWTVIELKGRKRFSRGIWAPAARIDALRSALAVERADPAYARQLEAGRRRRAAEQVEYVGEFRAAVETWLAFHPRHAADAASLAELIAAHATPVGSGTVARTERIPVEQRAEAATIAWLRHQTTGYDHMSIPREKGRRREVRRMLAERSRALLARYRAGQPVERGTCVLQQALARARG